MYNFGNAAEKIVEDTFGNGLVVQPGTKLKEVEKAVILETLKQQQFNRTRTAKVLGIGIRTLQRKLKQYQEESALAS